MDEDAETWQKWGQRRSVRVDNYNNATQVKNQWPARGTERRFEVHLTSQFKTSDKDRRATDIKECGVNAHNTENRKINLQLILMQNQQEPLETDAHESMLVSTL